MYINLRIKKYGVIHILAPSIMELKLEQMALVNFNPARSNREIIHGGIEMYAKQIQVYFEPKLKRRNTQ